jgi:TonB-dependent receptor
MPITLSRVYRITDEIIVEGYRFGESKSLNDQKEAANIKNVISEEQIKAFPDLNTADVLSRISGITIQRANGEGRFIAMRGTPSAMTNITINGQQVAYSNGENRSVELDVVSAAQLSGIEVTKVLTPDMDADAIGGSVNLKTRSAFDQPERMMIARVGYGQNSISDGNNPRVSFDFADVFGANDNIGVSIGLNYARTSAERHNNEQKWGSEDDVNGVEIPFAMTNSEVQFSNNVRDRYGLNTRLEFKLSENHQLYASAVYNFREDDQDRQTTRVRWDRGDYITPTEVEGVRMLKTLHDRVEEQEVSSYSLGGEHHFGASTFDFSLSTSTALTQKPAGQLKPEFEVRGVNLTIVGIDTPAPNWDNANVDIHDGSIYALDVVDVKYEDTTSDIDAAAMNFEMPMVLGSDTGTLKIGGKIRALSKIRADEREKWKWEGDDDLTLSQFENGGVVLLDSGYDLGNEYDSAGFRSFFFGNQTAGMFELDEVRNDVNLGEPYDAQEDVSSVYVMTTQEYGKLLVLGGVRAEFTDLDYTGSNLVLDDGEFISNELTNVKRDYDHVFPNLQFRYRLTPDTNIRLAYSEAMARPDFWNAMPYSFADLDEEEVVRGNPYLDPAISRNVDFLAEHFFEGIGILSGGVFFKQIDDFNFRSKFTEVGGPFDGFDVEQYVNGGSADLIGVEVAWQQQFTQLPGWMSGFGIFANYTYTDATSIDLGDETTRTDLVALPEQVQHVGNLALIYEKDSIVSRVSMNYNGKWIEEVGGDADEDEWRDATTTVDFSFTWMFENGLDLFFQANNLTNETKYVYSGIPTRSRQYSITGKTFNIGASWTF